MFLRPPELFASIRELLAGLRELPHLSLNRAPLRRERFLSIRERSAVLREFSFAFQHVGLARLEVALRLAGDLNPERHVCARCLERFRALCEFLLLIPEKFLASLDLREGCLDGFFGALKFSAARVEVVSTLGKSRLLVQCLRRDPVELSFASVEGFLDCRRVGFSLGDGLFQGLELLRPGGGLSRGLLELRLTAFQFAPVLLHLVSRLRQTPVLVLQVLRLGIELDL